MQSKSILLCSGGLDSQVVAHMLKVKNVETTLLFFDYAQRNLNLERKCVDKLSKKLGFKLEYVCLEPFSWSDSSIYSRKSDNQNQYIEMRNLIFLSYAMSLGEKLDIKDLYTGFIEPFEGDKVYPDANSAFVDNFNVFIETFGFRLRAPLSGMTKDEVIQLAKRYDITLNDFISCNVTENDKPCGQCPDCINVDKFYKNTL